MSKTGYVNGSDALMSVAGKAIGHCTEHTATFSAEVKARAVKPVATLGIEAGLWGESSVTGLSVTVSAKGVRHYGETEGGFKTLLELWKSAKPVEVTLFERNETAATGSSTALPAPYYKGNFIITKVSTSPKAKEDAEYDVELQSTGVPLLLDVTKITGETLTTKS